MRKIWLFVFLCLAIPVFAQTKLSELPVTTSLLGTDQILVNHVTGGILTTSTITLSNFQTNITLAQNRITNLTTDLAAKQTLDSELTALAAAASSADKLPYYTGVGTATTTVFTAAGRALVAGADVNAQRTTLGLQIGVDVQDFVSSTVTGTGSVVLHNIPTLVAPILGEATATSINNLTITAPASSATLSITNLKTLAALNTLTFSGTDGSTLNISSGGTLVASAFSDTTNAANITSGIMAYQRLGTGGDGSGTHVLTDSGTFQTLANSGFASGGRTIYVDSVNGDDTYIGRIDQPKLTLTAAKAAAISGDTIIVQPGTYNERNLLKNGVNWHFMTGAIVAYVGSASGGIFDDSASGANGPITCQITGYGNFTATGTSSNLISVVNLTNISSSVVISGNYFYATSTSTGVINTFNLLNGYCNVHARKIEMKGNSGAVASAIYWELGPVEVTADEINVLDSPTSTGGVFNIWSNSSLAPNGQLYVNATLFTNSQSIGAGQNSVLYVTGNTTQRNWIRANQIVGSPTNGARAINTGAGFNYIRAQKITGQIFSANCTTYVDTDKLTMNDPTKPPITVFGSGKTFIRAGHLDDTGSSGMELVLGSATNILHLRDTNIDRTTAGNAVNGVQFLENVTISGVASGYYDIVAAAAGTTVVSGAYNPAKTSGLIIQGHPVLAAMATGFPIPIVDPSDTPTFFQVGATGSTTYSYRIVAREGSATGRQTLPGPTATITNAPATLTLTNYHWIYWNAVGGATHYDVYRTVSNGTTNTTGRLTTVAALVGGQQQFRDRGGTADGTPIPTVNQTGWVAPPGAYLPVAQFPVQTIPPPVPLAGYNLFADSTGRFSWLGSNGFARTFDGTGLTADRVYTLPNASGTVMLTNNLTTVGTALVSLSDPSAITFLRLNADNTVSALDAAAFRTAIGAGAGGGDALVANPLSQFAATTSAQLKGVLSDELGDASGKVVFSLGTLAISSGKTLTANNTLTLTATDGATLAIGAGGTLGSAAYTASTTYQAADTDLTTYAGIPPSANVQSLLGAADYAAMKTLLSLTIGTNVQAWDIDLDTWATKTPFAGILAITTGKTATINNTLTFSGTDGSTLNVGTGGTLGSAAYTASTAYAPANAALSSIGFTVDGAGNVITTGTKGYISIPYNCTINSVTLLADVSGSVVVDIWKDTYANYPPTAADTITASAKPTITTAIKATDSTLTGWTTNVTAGDTIGFNVDSAATITRLTLVLKVTK